MNIRYDRIERAQALMREQGLVGIMVMNHDDYRYFFGEDRTQPRAILPFQGPPILISFRGEEPELRAALGDAPVKVFTNVGEQIFDVVTVFREIVMAAGGPPPGGRPRVGMQMWFHTPAFLVDLFRKANPMIDLVPSDPVMDPLRMVKEPGEIEAMKRAQSVAARGMDRARQLLAAGAPTQEVAAEVLSRMIKDGAEGTSTPMYVNVGIDTCWIHGHLSPRPVAKGDLLVVDLTPQVDGYCANLARTFVVGPPDERQRLLLDTYAEMREETRRMLRPGARTAELDARGKEVCRARGLGDFHIEGIGHGIGLRFEETPASTIMKAHRSIPLQEGMTVTIGHTILAIPGFGGVRHEDVYRVGPEGGEILVDYPIDPVLNS